MASRLSIGLLVAVLSGAAAVDYSCPACGTLADDLCLQKLDAAVDSLSAGDRLTMEKAVFTSNNGAACATLSDSDCLEALAV